MEDAAAAAEVAEAVGAAAVRTVGSPDEVTEVIAVDGGGTPYNIVEFDIVVAVDTGRLMLDAEDTTLVRVEAVCEDAADEAARLEAAEGVGSSVVPEESVVICS